MPAIAAIEYPSATRCKLADKCQNRPLSIPPRSKNGSKISSLVSLKTRYGAGKVEPVRRQTNSQNSIRSAITTSGGRTRAAVSFAILRYFSARGARFGVIVTTGAAVVGAAVGMATVVASALIAGIDIEIVSPRFNERAARKSVRPGLDQTSTRLIDSDFRYAAGFSGSNTLPSKKVSLPREVEAGMSAAATPIVLAASFQRSSRLTLAISALVSKPASYLPQRMSSVRNQRSWLWNG